MSSSYSTDLRIELIGTGDQAGVWGSTTNNTLGTLMEAAIAGYTSVSVIASPQALLALDGATDQARFNSIALTTITGANFTVCVPPTPKLYTFYNASAYTATITNATVKNGTTPTGGSTIAIPAGKTMSMWTDGTNFVQKSDHLISPTIASPAMSGTPTAPTAAFSTNTTQLATTAFVQAALQALHPVGSIYTSTVSTNPGTVFGFGTWVAYAAGRVLVGDGGGFTAGNTGGSADAIVVTHAHTASSGTQSADHAHGFSGTTNSTDLSGSFPTSANTGSFYGGSFTRGTQYSGNGGEPQTNSQVNFSGNHSHSFSGTTGGVNTNHNHAITVDSAGSSGTNANLQPYVVVYMWNRTA